MAMYGVNCCNWACVARGRGRHERERIVSLTNLPDRDSAQRVADALIESRAAACVNILAECSSVYRWQVK